MLVSLVSIYKWSCRIIMTSSNGVNGLLIGSEWCLCDGCIIARNRGGGSWTQWCYRRFPCGTTIIKNWINIWLTLISALVTHRWTTNSNDGPARTMASWASLWRRLNKSVLLIRTTASPALRPAWSAILPVWTWKIKSKIKI